MTNKVLNQYMIIALGLLSIFLSGVIGYQHVTSSSNEELIQSLREENKTLNMKILELNQQIKEANLQDKISDLDWTPDKEMTGILSMSVDDYMSLYDIYLQTEGEDLLREHLDKLVEEIPYVGGYTLDRYPADMETMLPSDDYGRYDLVFYIDVVEIQNLKDESPEQYEKILAELSSHGVVGF